VSVSRVRELNHIASHLWYFVIRVDFLLPVVSDPLLTLSSPPPFLCFPLPILIMPLLMAFGFFPFPSRLFPAWSSPAWPLLPLLGNLPRLLSFWSPSCVSSSPAGFNSVCLSLHPFHISCKLLFLHISQNVYNTHKSRHGFGGKAIINLSCGSFLFRKDFLYSPRAGKRTG